ncbi:MFS transporter [Propioniciclava sp.]|uniref:MFS transporter n=1 Tax=Propioniciclava sp. TaxID=2038686 RepID=UPI0026107407|nr:MFS transporter [Propioniciclava sp.]
MKLPQRKHSERTPTFASLAIRNYRLYFTGAAISNNGTWMQRIAQDWLVFSLTGSGLAVGITTALQFGPMLLLGLYGGVLADRYPQRRILLATQVGQMLCAIALAAFTFTGTITAEAIYMVALALGIITTLDNPARQSFVGLMVPPKLLPNAVALNSGNFNLARLTGPAIAGVLVAAVGAGWAFAVNALSFVAMLAALLLMDPATFEKAPRGRRGPGALREGLSYVREHPRIMVTLVLVLFIGTFGYNFPIILTAYTGHIFTGDSALYGILNSMMAVGSVFGALIAARHEAVSPLRVQATAGLFGAVMILLGLMAPLWAFMAVLVVTGLFAVSFNAMANATVQIEADPALRGRVMSLYFVLMMGTTPLGSLVTGWITDTWGAPAALQISGIICVLAAAGCAAASGRLERNPAPALG